MPKNILGFILGWFLGLIGLIGLLGCNTTEDEKLYFSGWVVAFSVNFVIAIYFVIMYF